MPSVLLELGYLSSRDDLALMVSEQWRDSTAKAVADAIIGYFGDRHAREQRPGAGLREDRPL